MEQIERSRHGWIGLEEFPAEPLRPVPDAQGIKAAPHRPGRPPGQARDIDGQEGQHCQRLIDLHRMPRHAVAEVDAPRQSGRHAIGPVRQALEKAAQPPDRDPEGEGAGEQAAGRAAHAARQLVELDPHHRPGQGTDDTVRKARRRGHQGVQRTRQPGPDRRASGQTGRITWPDRPRRPFGQSSQPPAVEQQAEARAGGPSQKVEQHVNAGQGGNGHLQNRPREGLRRNLDRPCQAAPLRDIDGP